jgi:hypothetical protein
VRGRRRFEVRDSTAPGESEVVATDGGTDSRRLENRLRWSLLVLFDDWTRRLDVAVQE